MQNAHRGSSSNLSGDSFTPDKDGHPPLVGTSSQVCLALRVKPAKVVVSPSGNSQEVSGAKVDKSLLESSIGLESNQGEVMVDKVARVTISYKYKNYC